MLPAELLGSPGGRASAANMLSSLPSSIPPACAHDLSQLLILNYTSAAVSLGMLTASSDHMNDAGDYHACSRQGPSAQYCLIQARGGNTVIETEAVCLPSSCPPDAVLPALNATVEAVGHLVPQAAGFTAEFSRFLASPALKVTCGAHHPGPLSPGAWCTVLAIVLLIVLVIAGSLMRHAELKREGAAQLQADRITEPLNASTEQVKKPRRSPFAAVVLAFAVQPNLDFLFKPSASRKFTALEGVRTLSMLYIILAHSLDFQTYVGFDEPFESKDPAQVTISSQTLNWYGWLPVISANYAVDCFFLLSGFLGGYVLLGRPKHIGLPAFVLRYIRLTPTLALALAFYATLATHCGSGPHWFKIAEEAEGCQKWWWSNLVYTNNFAPAKFDESCMSWTWYLACDTQMFLIALPVLALRASKRGAVRRGAVWLCVALVLGSIAATWIVMPATGVGGASIGGGTGPSQQDVVYDKPYTRMAPYFIGTLLAFALKDRPASSAKLPAAWATMLLLGAVATVNGVIWIEAKQQDWWTMQGHYAYSALARSIFSAAVAALLWLCVTGQAPLVNQFLSLSVFDVPAKLTYSAYLVHPIIIRIYWFKAVALTTYSPLNHMTTFFAMACYAYICAVVVALLIELPSANLIKLLMPAPKKKTPVVEPDAGGEAPRGR